MREKESTQAKKYLWVVLLLKWHRASWKYIRFLSTTKRVVHQNFFHSPKMVKEILFEQHSRRRDVFVAQKSLGLSYVYLKFQKKIFIVNLIKSTLECNLIWPRG